MGRLGLQWGEKNRGPIMFWAFWFSFIGWILLAATLACISTSAESVKAVPFFQGTITFTNQTTLEKSDFNFYAGLNRVVVEGCDFGDSCPPHSQSWDSVSCDEYLEGCSECKSVSSSSVTMVIVSFITQFPQISTDLTRSVGKHIVLYYTIPIGILYYSTYYSIYI